MATERTADYVELSAYHPSLTADSNAAFLDWVQVKQASGNMRHAGNCLTATAVGGYVLALVKAEHGMATVILRADNPSLVGDGLTCFVAQVA
jgi:hypothetical protein